MSVTTGAHAAERAPLDPGDDRIGGTVLAVYNGGAQGEAAIREAVTEARRRNARIDVVGVMPLPYLTPLAAAGGLVLCLAPCWDRLGALRSELRSAVDQAPTDVSIRFHAVPGRLTASVDPDSYACVTGLRRKPQRRWWRALGRKRRIHPLEQLDDVRRSVESGA